jgi:arylsulfatase
MNIILLIIDALRYDHVNTEITPNLMKLAQKGTFFTNAFSCNSSTRASIPCILCSKITYDPENNIASVLKKFNMLTVMIHSNPLIRSFYNGFEETIDLKSSKFKLSKNWKKRLRKNLPVPVITGLKKIRANIAEDDAFLPYARAKETLDFTKEWMDDHDNYFLWLHLMDPHIPYYPLKTKLNLSRKEMRNINDHIIESVHGNYQLKDKEIEQSKTLYKEDIHEMDEELGTFLSQLDGNNLLIITSDHGEEFNEYGQFSHHENKIIPELIHVPLIFYGLNVSRGKKISDYISTLSITPSILESLDVKTKIGYGKSLWSTIRSGSK